MLREAGYRPAVFHNMAPPWFLRLGNTPVARPDPFDHYSPHVSPRQALPLLLLLLLLRMAATAAADAGMRMDLPATPHRPCPTLRFARNICMCLLRRALFVAKGGSWSPATHRLWPDSFKAAVRTMLLAASGSGKRSGGGSGQLNLLAVLPPDALQRVIELASPLSAWV